MNLRITVEGKSYEVQVDVVESSLSRVAEQRGPLNGLGAATIAPPTKLVAEAESRSKADVKPTKQPASAEVRGETWPERTTHHIYGPLPAKPGEVVCPVAGVIVEVAAKAGDKVKQHAPLVVLEVSKSIATDDRPVVGTVRASGKGTLKAVFVKAGDKVKAGQVLCEMDTP